MTQVQPMTTETVETAETLSVMKVVVRGVVTSFRYPHFVQGVQPTYEIPPPSTVYGLICAATGRFEPPGGLRFGLHFTYEARFRDLEHIHLDVPYRMANPFTRELLYNPVLTLYLAPADYAEYFAHPRYPITLGRSQDLMTVEPPTLVSLQKASRAYFEHTLMPSEYAPRFQRTIAVTMAKYINPRREAQWASYAILKERARYPDEEDPMQDNYAPVWIDPESPDFEGRRRGVILHSFT